MFVDAPNDKVLYSQFERSIVFKLQDSNACLFGKFLYTSGWFTANYSGNFLFIAILYYKDEIALVVVDKL